MDEVLFGLILKKVSLGASIFGVLVGLDLLFGAKITLAAKRLLDKAYNIDKAIAKPQTRVLLGVTMLFISLVMLLLILTVK